MKIQQILDQHRRDFIAIYECEHCGVTKQASGYDDAYFHQTVIPDMVCDKCGKKGPETYRPLTTRYAEGTAI
jgi:ribosomal protein L37AE/L43A